MKASVIFSENLRSLRMGSRRVINQGGMASGKTVNILGVLATMCSEETSGVTTVTAKSFPHLKGGALRDFMMYVYPSFVGAIKSYHKTDHLFTFHSGSMLEFKVYETEQDARGAKRKRLFVNEANSFDWMTFFQLDSRSEQTVIDYNPSIRFWSQEKLIGVAGNKTLYSDHRHNPFLSKEKHLEIERICEFVKCSDGRVLRDAKGEPVIENGDYEMWKVYARGLTGNVTGLIFPNWEVIDDLDFPSEECVWGIDFGFTNDPTAIVKCCRVGNTIYVHEVAYKPGMSARECKESLVLAGYNENQPLFCEHEPNMVKLIRQEGGVTCFPANKGAGSINAGIELLKQHKVKYTCSSKNIKLETSQYIWMQDKEGNWTNVPTDRMNHLMDATRYACYTSWLRR